MILLGAPDDLSNYFALEDAQAFILEQKGYHAKYFEGGIHYFVKSNKLEKLIKKLGLSVEF